MGMVWQTVRRIAKEILRVKGLSSQTEVECSQTLESSHLDKPSIVIYKCWKASDFCQRWLNWQVICNCPIDNSRTFPEVFHDLLQFLNIWWNTSTHKHTKLAYNKTRAWGNFIGPFLLSFQTHLYGIYIGGRKPIRKKITAISTFTAL